MKHTSLKTIIGLAGLALTTSAMAGAAHPSMKSDDSMMTGPYARIGFAETWHNGFSNKTGSYAAKRPDASTSFHLGVGAAFSPAIRADFVLGYGEVKYKASKTGESSAQKIGSLNAMVNGYYDINMHKMMVPYLAAGVGFSRNHSSALQLNGANRNGTYQYVFPGALKTSFAWNAGVGVKFNFDKSYALDVGYRYVDLGQTKVGSGNGSYTSPVGITPQLNARSGASQKLRGHQALVSLLYKF